MTVPPTPNAEPWIDAPDYAATLSPHMRDERWVRIQVRIRENSSGLVRTWSDHAGFTDDSEQEPSIFIWTEGNYSCDCNRRLFFLWACGEAEADGDERACSDTEYSIEVINPANGRVIYSELRASPPS